MEKQIFDCEDEFKSEEMAEMDEAAFMDDIDEEEIRKKLENGQPLNRTECEIAWDAYFMEGKELFLKLVKQDAFPSNLIEEAYDYTGAQHDPLELEDYGVLMDRSSQEFLQGIAKGEFMSDLGDVYGKSWYKKFRNMAKERLTK